MNWLSFTDASTNINPSKGTGVTSSTQGHNIVITQKMHRQSCVFVRLTFSCIGVSTKMARFFNSCKNNILCSLSLTKCHLDKYLGSMFRLKAQVQ